MVERCPPFQVRPCKSVDARALPRVIALEIAQQSRPHERRQGVATIQSFDRILEAQAFAGIDDREWTRFEQQRRCGRTEV